MVRIEGEVLFPGLYVLSSPNERLSDLIKRAGGVSPQAYIQGATLKRKKTKDEYMKELALQTLQSQNLDHNRDRPKQGLRNNRQRKIQHCFKRKRRLNHSATNQYGKNRRLCHVSQYNELSGGI